MKKMLNTLYVQTQGAYLRLDHETLVMEVENEKQKQMPLHPIASVVVIGNIMVSPHLIAKCASEGRSFVFLDSRGRFQYRIQGPVSGNVLLRRAQHKCLDNQKSALSIARNMVAGKLQNARQVLLRGARESDNENSTNALKAAASRHAESLNRLESVACFDEIRGLEGMAASDYFGVLQNLIRVDDEHFRFNGRNRRPPRDPVNALLSYLYTLLRFECSSALESVGLDPQIGFLHAIRPGRPALALDIMEEIRSPLADRLALTLINRKQLNKGDFDYRTGGSVFLDETGRKTVITAWQERKNDEVTHPVLKKKIQWGLVPHVQAQILARHLRGDLEHYIPFLWR